MAVGPDAAAPVIGGDDESGAIGEDGVLLDGGEDAAELLIDGADHVAIGIAAPVEVMASEIGLAEMDEGIVGGGGAGEILQQRINDRSDQGAVVNDGGVDLVRAVVGVDQIQSAVEL